jgi:hypothetical protein
MGWDKDEGEMKNKKQTKKTTEIDGCGNGNSGSSRLPTSGAEPRTVRDCRPDPAPQGTVRPGGSVRYVLTQPAADEDWAIVGGDVSGGAAYVAVVQGLGLGALGGVGGVCEGGEVGEVGLGVVAEGRAVQVAETLGDALR